METKYSLFDAQLANAQNLIGSEVFGVTASTKQKIRGVVKTVRSGIVNYDDPRPARILVDVLTSGGWVMPCEIETVNPA